MTEVAVAEYLGALFVCWFVGLKFGAAAKFIKDLGNSA